MSYRFLRGAAAALWVYGLLGIGVALVLLSVGFSTMAQIASLQKALDTQRLAVVQSVRTMSNILQDTALATSDFQLSIDTARGSADQASRLANDSAGTFRSMGVSFTDLSIFGIQPLVGFQPEFDNNADHLQQLAISLGSTREALAKNGADMGRVGSDLSRLKNQLDALATSLGQPSLFGFDTRSLLPLQIAFFGICLLIVVQSAFSIVAGVVIFRAQQTLGTQQPGLPVPRTATTNGVTEAGRVRAS